MERYIVTVLPGGRITIPAPVRRDLDLHAGDTLVWWWEGREVHFRKKTEADEIATDANDPVIKEVSASFADREAKEK
jgi:AbrB family looped-hinge helix DNA binding protein